MSAYEREHMTDREGVPMHLQLERARAENALLRDALDRIAIGVIVVERSGQPCFMNRHAAELLEIKRGDARSWERGLQQIHDDGAHDGATHCRSLTRGNPSSAMQVVCVPLDRAATSAVVFLGDPQRPLVTSDELLRQLFDFTASEARVALELTNGRSLEESAARLAIAPSTARSHLKKIFAKTHTRRQGDLVRLIAAMLAVIDAR